ncbi:MAG: hypothetical protein QF798_02060 [Candidatus Woesearchaeota archaeon]|jgi:hypothetical protein|nr:hypothetical protein [Candidatus Woesearchaeota archaeon]|tara:strand:+ start:819 stop:953 length:135 start_codon:yes stop_codon:yes gene_type:complete
MVGDNYCKKCKIEMKLLREEIIVGSKYKILKCEKCKHEVARAES